MGAHVVRGVGMRWFIDIHDGLVYRKGYRVSRIRECQVL